MVPDSLLCDLDCVPSSLRLHSPLVKGVITLSQVSEEYDEVEASSLGRSCLLSGLILEEISAVQRTNMDKGKMMSTGTGARGSRAQFWVGARSLQGMRRIYMVGTVPMHPCVSGHGTAVSTFPGSAH